MVAAGVVVAATERSSDHVTAANTAAVVANAAIVVEVEVGIVTAWVLKRAIIDELGSTYFN